MDFDNKEQPMQRSKVEFQVLGSLTLRPYID